MNLGQQPKSKAMQDILCYQILKGIISHDIATPSEQNYPSIIVHHYTDKPEGLQLEYELRLTDGTCKFGRYFCKVRVKLQVLCYTLGIKIQGADHASLY